MTSAMPDDEAVQLGGFQQHRGLQSDDNLVSGFDPDEDEVDAEPLGPSVGRWLAVEGEGFGGATSYVFWESAEGVPQAVDEEYRKAHPTPDLWANYPLASLGGDKFRLPDPGKYVVDGGEGDNDDPFKPRASKRNKLMLVTSFQNFRAIVGRVGVPRSGSTYNPFGRFSTDLVVAAHPAQNLPMDLNSDLGAVINEALEHLRESSDESVSSTVAVGFAAPPTQRLDGSWDAEAVANDEEHTRLYLSMVTPVAVVYTSQKPREPATPGHGMPSPNVDSVFGVSSGVKGMTPDSLGLVMGGKRSKSQKAVMGGNSANTVAEGLGFQADNDTFRWEWLHLIAHSMGGATSLNGRDVSVQDAQVPGNLVLGTREANTEMIVAEESIKALIVKHDIAADVGVIVTFHDPAHSYPKNIRYEYVFWQRELDGDGRPIGLGTFRWEFDPMRRTEPTASGHKFVRDVMGSLGQAMVAKGEREREERNEKRLARLASKKSKMSKMSKKG